MSNKDKEKTKSGEETYTQKAQKTVDTFTTMQKEQADGQIALAEKGAAASIERATRDTNKQIDEANDAYREIINTADIQKELDIRNIRETRANMGLSRSGISSTEQTAAILSAGNKTAAAQRQRQAAIDTLQQSLLDYKGDVENQLASTKLGINQTRDNNIFSFADTKLSQAEQMDLDVSQTKETNRQNGLATLLQNGTINYDVYSQAMGDTGITVEAAKRMGDAARIAEINNSNLPDDVKQLALTQGWWLKDAVAYHEQQTNNDETTRQTRIREYVTAGLIDLPTANKAIDEGWTITQLDQYIETTKASAEAERITGLETALKNKDISQDVYDYAKQNGLTAEQAKSLQEQATASENAAKKETNDAILDGAKKDGLISETVCEYAKTYGLELKDALKLEQEWGILAGQKAGSSGSGISKNPYASEIKILLDKQVIDPYTWAYADENHLTPNQALVYQENKNHLDEALENREIDKVTYDDALKNGYTAESVLEVQKETEAHNARLKSIAETAKSKIKITTKTVKLSNGRTREIITSRDPYDAIEYLKNGDLKDEEIYLICEEVGITSSEWDGWRPRYTSTTSKTATSVKSTGVPTVEDGVTTITTTGAYGT